MIRVIQSGDRHYADHGWLQTHWHFSFGDYHDPRNMNWGALRVFNDDVIRGGGGFDSHPHRDMEIVTYVLEGQLEHRDDLGNKGVIHPGEVQVMTAGRGIVHAEYNHSEREPVRLVQLWILPRNRGNKPRWEQQKFDAAERKNRLLPVVSAGEVPGTLAIDQDAAIFVSSLEKGQAVTHATRAERKLYLFVIKGLVKANDEVLSAGDQGRIEDVASLRIEAEEDAELMLLDLPAIQ